LPTDRATRCLSKYSRLLHNCRNRLYNESRQCSCSVTVDGRVVNSDCATRRCLTEYSRLLHNCRNRLYNKSRQCSCSVTVDGRVVNFADGPRDAALSVEILPTAAQLYEQAVQQVQAVELQRYGRRTCSKLRRRTARRAVCRNTPDCCTTVGQAVQQVQAVQLQRYGRRTCIKLRPVNFSTSFTDANSSHSMRCDSSIINERSRATLHSRLLLTRLYKGASTAHELN